MSRIPPHAGVCFALAAALVTVPSIADEPASASLAVSEPSVPVSFGLPGQLVVSSDLLVRFAYTTASAPEGSTTKPDANVALVLAPAADYFLVPNISVGGAVQLAYESQGDASATGLGVAPRVGYVLSLGEKLTFWPKVGVGYLQVTTKTPAPVTTGGGVDALGGSSKITDKKVQAQLFAPVLFHPAPHFFLGGGPFVSMDVYSKAGRMNGYKETTFGLMSVVGGYF